MRNATRSLLLLVVASAMMLFVFVPRHESSDEPGPIQLRALFGPGPTETTTEAAATRPATTSEASAKPTSTTSSSSSATLSTTSQTTSSSSSSSSTAAASSTGPANSPVPTTATNSAGQVITSFVVPTTTTSSSATPTNTSSSSGGGLGTGSIVGLSVAGGIAVIAIVLFFVWKFTRKRFADFDDNEAIKWPELNAHGNDVHALPTNSTGRAGFGPENDSDVNLVRAPSPGGAYASSIAASSVPEVYAGGDPYAVPPLPHLNPNQPYRDDPGTYGQPAGYYDPYRGPVPHTFNDVISDGHGAESIPMTQMARTRSPGPQMAYDMPARGSPAPQAAMGYLDSRSGTPNPAALGAGRASPGPQAAYYMDRVGTPNPAAGGAGRASPHSQAAYGYGP